MQKIFHITFFCFCILLFYGCKPDCSSYKITDEEENFILYKLGDIVFFKNDSTGIIDTLLVRGRNHVVHGQSGACEETIIGVEANLYFPAIGGVGDNIYIWSRHNQTPYVDIVGGSSFILNVPPQTITINSITYNDVYSVSIDSNSITNDKIPWKINYSRSKGFVRFYMKKGVSWSKL